MGPRLFTRSQLWADVDPSWSLRGHGPVRLPFSTVAFHPGLPVAPIRVRLQFSTRTRDLAMFNFEIDSYCGHAIKRSAPHLSRRTGCNTRLEVRAFPVSCGLHAAPHVSTPSVRADQRWCLGCRGPRQTLSATDSGARWFQNGR